MLVFRNIFRYQKQVFQTPKRGSKEAQEVNLKKQMQRKMNEKIQNQTSNIENNTPRIVSGLMAIMTIPSFYYFYTMLQTDFNDLGFYQNIKLTTDWINMKTALNCGMLIGLQLMKFNDFRAKNKLVSKTPLSYSLYALPILCSLISYSCIDSTSSWWALSSAVGIVGTLGVYSHAVNFGAAPFWSFALTYQLFFLDLIMVASVAYAMKNFNNHRQKRPDLYAQY